MRHILNVNSRKCLPGVIPQQAKIRLARQPDSRALRKIPLRGKRLPVSS
jgi:hypothetical protein